MDNSQNSDDNRQVNLPAIGETDLDDKEAGPVSEPAKGTNQPQPPYQDDLDYRDADTDPVMDEENDNPAEELGIPEQEYKDELDKFEDTDIGTGDDDMRETIEDRDEDDDNATSGTQ